MILKLITCLVSLVMVLKIQAQITITQADMPKKYQRYLSTLVRTDTSSNFDATKDGNNGEWDLSIFASRGSGLDTTLFEDPGTTGYRDSFPNANIVFPRILVLRGVETKVTVMAQSDETGVKWLGIIDDSSRVIRFEKPWQHEKLPITGTSSHTDVTSFRTVESFSGLSITTESNLVYYSDVTGYGNLKMLDNKNYEVLRLRIREVDSTRFIVKTGGFGGDTTITNVNYRYYYEFWANGFGYPLARVAVDSAYNDSSRTVEVLDISNTSVGAVHSDFGVDFSIFPNPTSGQLTLYSPVEGGTVKIYNVAMQEVATSTLSQTMHQMDVTDLPNGVYVVQLYTETGEPIISEKVIIQ